MTAVLRVRMVCERAEWEPEWGVKGICGRSCLFARKGAIRMCVACSNSIRIWLVLEG